MDHKRKGLPFRNVLLEIWEGGCISFQKVKYKTWISGLRNPFLDDNMYMYVYVYVYVLYTFFTLN